MTLRMAMLGNITDTNKQVFWLEDHLTFKHFKSITTMMVIRWGSLVNGVKT
jgi:hypothetical protein